MLRACGAKALSVGGGGRCTKATLHANQVTQKSSLSSMVWQRYFRVIQGAQALPCRSCVPSLPAR